MRFPLSLRMIEEMLSERGIVVSYETIRRWGRKFGQAYVKQLRSKKPSRKDIWYLDEVVISIGGRKHWLWRAVDQDGYVLDEIVQTRRDTKAAKRLGQTAEEARPQAETHHHRQVALIRRGKAGSYAKRRTPVAQRA